MSEWKEFRQELLNNPETKEAYDSHAAERALAKALIAQRLENDLTQKEMATLMNMPQGNISRMESGERMPTLSTLQKAARALNVPLEIRLGSHQITLSP